MHVGKTDFYQDWLLNLLSRKLLLMGKIMAPGLLFFIKHKPAFWPLYCIKKNGCFEIGYMATLRITKKNWLSMVPGLISEAPQRDKLRFLGKTKGIWIILSHDLCFKLILWVLNSVICKLQVIVYFAVQMQSIVIYSTNYNKANFSFLIFPLFLEM